MIQIIFFLIKDIYIIYIDNDKYFKFCNQNFVNIAFETF